MKLRPKIPLRPLDFLIFVLAIALFTVSILFLGKKSTGKKYVNIQAHHGDEYIFPLNKNARQEIEGAIGISVIVIKDGEAFFEDSCCPNKTCVSSTPAKGTGDWIVCLPNQVFLRIDGNDDDGVDVLGK